MLNVNILIILIIIINYDNLTNLVTPLHWQHAGSDLPYIYIYIYIDARYPTLIPLCSPV